RGKTLGSVAGAGRGRLFTGLIITSQSLDRKIHSALERILVASNAKRIEGIIRCSAIVKSVLASLHTRRKTTECGVEFIAATCAKETTIGFTVSCVFIAGRVPTMSVAGGAGMVAMRSRILRRRTTVIAATTDRIFYTILQPAQWECSAGSDTVVFSIIDSVASPAVGHRRGTIVLASGLCVALRDTLFGSDVPCMLAVR